MVASSMTPDPSPDQQPSPPPAAPAPMAPPTYASPPAAAAAPGVGQLSPDGRYMWNGTQWMSAISPDGRYRWDGSGWIPVSVGPSAYAVPAVGATGGLGYQLGGSAAWSMGFGLVSILVPFFTNFYFPILPIVGIWRAVIAFRSGRVAGAVIGVVLNVLGGLVSLFASGLIGQ